MISFPILLTNIFQQRKILLDLQITDDSLVLISMNYCILEKATLILKEF